MNCISTGSADCKPQGCRITVHPRYEEADTFIWKMLRRWTTPPGNYANVGYQQDSGWDGNCLTLHIPAPWILNYSDCKVCPSFIVLLLSLSFKRMRNRWVAVILRHIFAWRSIRFLQILSEAVSGHTHTHLKPNFWLFRVVLVFPPLKCGHPVLHHLTMTCRRRIQEWFDGFPARRMRHDEEGGGGFWSPEQNPVKRFFSDEPSPKKSQLALKKDMLTSNIDAWETKHMMRP